MAVVVPHAVLPRKAGLQVNVHAHVHGPDCGCGHHAAPTVNAARRYDPTRTGATRRAFEAEINRRFAALKKLVRIALVDRDVLGLQDAPLAANARRPRHVGRTNAVAPPPVRAFQFERSGAKVAGFMDWLTAAAYDGILDTTLGTPIASAAENAWTNVYVRSAYQRGLQSSYAQMRRGGIVVEDSWINAAFFRPVHADRAGLIFTRTFEELTGVTDAMAAQMSRELAQGMIEGVGARELARRLENRVDKIGRTRARMVARTEVVAAHAEATLNSYEEAGLEGVNILSEFTTAQDDAVCPICEALQGRTFTIEEARGVIPVHPNCRCAWLPVVGPNQRGRVLQ